ncbi:hypothetical protein D3C87_140800 [compost metagenome]
MMTESSFFHKIEFLFLDYVKDPVCFAIGMVKVTLISMKIIMVQTFKVTNPQKSSSYLIVVPFKVIAIAGLLLGVDAGRIKRRSSELLEKLNV